MNEHTMKTKNIKCRSNCISSSQHAGIFSFLPGYLAFILPVESRLGINGPSNLKN